MSIFSSIMSKIFGTDAAAATPAGATAGSGAATAPTPVSSPTSSPPANATAAAQAVDVEAVLSELASKNHQQLNWRTSIVDLLKLLDLESSLTARQELARELHYTGNMNDSAAMNIWLQKQVMQKLAENGGKVPDELKS